MEANRPLREGLAQAGLDGVGAPVPFPCWDRHTEEFASFTCPCPHLTDAFPSSFCRRVPSRHPRSIASSPLLEQGAPTGSRVIVLRPPRLAGPPRRLEQILRDLRRSLDEAEAVARRQVDVSEPALSDLPVSGREREIVRGLAAGRPLTQVAADLGISLNTARNHLKSIFRKLHVRSQSELLQFVRADAT